ncbi:MAG: nucleotidyltransferase domain-containing protein [Actinomycetota bacterium]
MVAAAEVGSLSVGEGDRWSDVDLTFAIDDQVDTVEVLDDWTSTFVDELGGMRLFDLTSGPSIYRVFMFPECLQLDVSFSSARDFKPTSPRFRLVFGEADEMQLPEPPDPGGLLGWAVMWATHARRCIERELWWQAEHSITSMRQHALSFACRRRELPAGYGRGIDRLPSDVRHRFASTLVLAYEPDALKVALKNCVAALSAECADDPETDEAIGDRLGDTVAGL